MDLKLGSSVALTSSQKANIPNQFFSSCFSPPSDPTSHHPHPPSPLSSPLLTSVPCSTQEVHKLISNHKLHTASVPDGVSSQMLRATAPSITRIFNESHSQAKVPSAWKTCNVTPIPKGGDPTCPSNYRPVSLLSPISKVLERIIHKRISNFLYSPSQLPVWFSPIIIYTGKHYSW